MPEGRSGYTRTPITHPGLKAGTQYTYRIFPYKDGVFGQPVTATAMTEPAVAPDTRLNLRVSAVGPTKLKLTWNAVSARNNGGSPVSGYYIEVSNDIDNNLTPRSDPAWISVSDLDATTNAAEGPADDEEQTAWEVDDPDTREYTYVELDPNEVRWFRVIALNAVATVTVADDAEDMPDAEAMEALASAVPAYGKTARASVPMAPNGLVAEQARNSSLPGTSNRGVLLLWNAPDDPTWRRPGRLRHRPQD